MNLKSFDADGADGTTSRQTQLSQTTLHNDVLDVWTDVCDVFIDTFDIATVDNIIFGVDTIIFGAAANIVFIATVDKVVLAASAANVVLDGLLVDVTLGQVLEEQVVDEPASRQVQLFQVLESSEPRQTNYGLWGNVGVAEVDASNVGQLLEDAADVEVGQAGAGREDQGGDERPDLREQVLDDALQI